MSSIGDTDASSRGKCLELSLSTPIEILELSQSGSVVDALRLTKEGKSKEYGDIGGDIFKLEFSEEQPLIGLYGYEDSSKIAQLGFYTLDAQCAATKPEETEEVVEEEKEEVKEEKQTENQKV